MSNRYAIVSPENIVVNVIVWDGEADYDPSPNHAVRVSDPYISLGWAYDPATGVFTEPAKENSD